MLHACGGASDAALQLAAQRGVPFAVSPCRIGKLRRGPASRWLRELAEPDATAAEAAFALLAAWADSEHLAAPAPAPSVARRSAASDVPAAEAAVAAHLVAAAHAVVAARQQRANTLVELDRLAALGEGEGRQEPTGPAAAPGRLLRVEGAAMRTSGRAEVITGPVASSVLFQSRPSFFARCLPLPRCATRQAVPGGKLAVCSRCDAHNRATAGANLSEQWTNCIVH